MADALDHDAVPSVLDGAPTVSASGTLGVDAM
jgi:hypothetical protein